MRRVAAKSGLDVDRTCLTRDPLGKYDQDGTSKIKRILIIFFVLKKRGDRQKYIKAEILPPLIITKT